jgi:hypothetical protein
MSAKLRTNARFHSALFALSLAMVTAAPGCGYNSLVGADEEVKSSWGQVENVYQRRADLVPNLAVAEPRPPAGGVGGVPGPEGERGLP